MNVVLDNILVKKNIVKSSYQKFYKLNNDPDYVKNLKRFVEVVFVLERGNKMKSKISNRGKEISNG